jgi:outer membrane protein OmpA-like peptidoglycan-associated protein
VGSEAVLSRALELQPGQAGRMVAGMALGGWADNAQGLGLTAARGEVATLLEVAQQVWRKQGSLSRTVDVKPWVDGRFVAALADRFAGRALEESEPFRSRTSLSQRSLFQRPVDLHFEQGTDTLLPGATRRLDALGSALRRFPAAALQVEGWQAGGQPPADPRAREVARYLEKRWGVEAARLLPGAGGADAGTADAGAAGGQDDVLQVVLVGR